jgi:hypothetical protein
MSDHSAVTSSIHGVLAEFPTPEALLAAVKRTTSAGYTKTDAFSPFPIHGMEEAIGFTERKVAKIILAGGLFGGLGGFGMQYWMQVVDFPMNIGGRPWYSWVPWIPPTFELTILFASFAAVFGMFALNGLPQPYHPVFNHPRFSRASQDAFFLIIETADPKFDSIQTPKFLAGLGATEVVEVED